MPKMRQLLLSTIVVASMSIPAAADSSCLQELTSLNVMESFTMKSPRKFSHRLRSTNVSGPYLTTATINGNFDGDRLHLQFRLDESGLGLPYNIFAVLVASADEVFAWYDLAKGCKGIPGAVSPGGSYDLTAVKLHGASPLNVHIVVWGRR